ncbi:ATP-binding cassette domain-containing protein [Campylobacter mucosalis]|uniref:Dipeptide/oligopeptide/nickel ABC transporter, ATP-binding protein n=1 Tax=Campylobacter mucosalis CCUG 21559 TaxID=1032067 RepID=A0A6G5QFD0_9BACT|nr:ATP-binding cassette domain-containing protein [Campylobacter mucosalis]QCD44395.1 dipeptide/oligopeptide/nickel ABC transporter, ATP-binding protein [Campylobacter mucosalis CCUG 21559]
MLEVKNLSIKAQDKIIVDDISFSLKRGIVTALIGKSGVGKSLCATGIFGIFTNGTSGKITLNFNNEPVKNPSKIISTIMQNPRTAFSPILSIGSHAKSILKANDMLDQNFDQLLKTELKNVGLKDEVADRYPFELSGGMLQRAMIALALITKPKFLIADEPTTDLDAITQTEILSLLSKLVKQKNMGLLLITHDFGVINAFADEILVLEDTKIVEKADKNEIFTSPKSKSSRELLNAYEALK